jgi:eukaryotic-like serine/threonine-protein kinase
MTGKDGAILIYVPEGDFLMGSLNTDSRSQVDEKPQHLVTLDAFWIDLTEVTNKQYAACVEAGACKPPFKSSSTTRESYYGNPEFDAFPVIYMNWEDANAYCSWVGRGLPTEAQWEKAARGTDGRIYPWGNNEPNIDLLNFNENVGDTTKPGNYEAGKSFYGAYDMAGNVWEWVNDRYSQIYYQKSPILNPLGPDAGETRVLRGGAYDTQIQWNRAAERSQGIPPKYYYVYIGFRCALSSP